MMFSAVFFCLLCLLGGIPIIIYGISFLPTGMGTNVLLSGIFILGFLRFALYTPRAFAPLLPDNAETKGMDMPIDGNEFRELLRRLTSSATKVELAGRDMIKFLRIHHQEDEGARFSHWFDPAIKELTDIISVINRKYLFAHLEREEDH